jgi:hypothetical protein
MPLYTLPEGRISSLIRVMVMGRSTYSYNDFPTKMNIALQQSTYTVTYSTLSVQMRHCGIQLKNGTLSMIITCCCYLNFSIPHNTVEKMEKAHLGVNSNIGANYIISH